MKKNERQQALDALICLFTHQTPLAHLIGPLPPFSRELCFGVCRYYISLEALAHIFLTKKPKEQDIWISLLMGLYQLHYLQLADYAVVKETVALIATKYTWAKGLINAVLRRYCRERTSIIPQLEQNSIFIHNHPAWFIKRMQEAWPLHWQAILHANDRHPPMSLRVNAQCTTPIAYFTKLHETGTTATRHTYSTQGLTLNTPCDVHTLPGFAEGHFAVQDEAAQLAPILLDLKPGLRLLDACSAPGGKTCHILETEPHLLTCVALDIDRRRLARVSDNLTRLHLQATLCVGDALDPSSWWDGILFDRILLDAPCSAIGVIRRHPDIKCLRTEQEITAIIQVQHDLLEALWPLLATGGRLVYATCSVIPEENEQQLAHFVSNHSNASTPNTETYTWGHNTGHGWQILPGENNMDGFFYGVLMKS